VAEEKIKWQEKFKGILDIILPKLAEENF